MNKLKYPFRNISRCNRVHVTTSYPPWMSHVCSEPSKSVGTKSAGGCERCLKLPQKDP